MVRSTTPSPSGVFISYRRQDTAPYARLLREELSKHLGPQQVFMDVDSIQVGVDFAEVITQAVSTCEVLLAVVGPQWLTATDAEGRRRLDDPDDTVRLEIEAALARNILVIPVLVDNTPMPRRQQLPESLAPFARRNALELTNNRYAYDVKRLVAAVKRVVSETDPPGQAPSLSVSAPDSSLEGTDIRRTVTTTTVLPTSLEAAGSEGVTHSFDLAALSAVVDDRSNDELIAVIQQEEGGVAAMLDKIFGAMVYSFNPARAAGQQGIVQYEIVSPDTTRDYFMRITDERCDIQRGRTENPRATMRVQLPDFLRIITGKAKSRKLFMTGKLKISGDLFFAQSHLAWFDSPVES
jgi:putative sterol carrier protein